MASTESSGGPTTPSRSGGRMLRFNEPRRLPMNWDTPFSIAASGTVRGQRSKQNRWHLWFLAPSAPTPPPIAPATWPRGSARTVTLPQRLPGHARRSNGPALRSFPEPAPHKISSTTESRSPPHNSVIERPRRHLGVAQEPISHLATDDRHCGATFCLCHHPEQLSGNLLMTALWSRVSR